MIQNRSDNYILYCVMVWFPTIAYCGLIFYLSSNPAPVTIELFPMSDKIVHFFEYGILSILFFYSLKNSRTSLNTKTVIILAIFFTGFYGVTDEIHQYFVPERTASMGDATADLIGAVIFQSRNILKNI